MSKETTFHQHQEHLTVLWTDPALIPKRKTTHDLQTEPLFIDGLKTANPVTANHIPSQEFARD
jgi:hypothetical protein